MSSCCTPDTNRNEACCTVSNAADVMTEVDGIRHCPTCGEKGKQVGLDTLKSMLAISLHHIRPVGYRFCRNQACDVVYFSLDGEHIFSEGDLRVAVYQKRPNDDDVFVCYCFSHTPGSIRAEIEQTGQSTVVETVTQGTQSGECACEIRNPQGSCCLGNVSAVVKQSTQDRERVTGCVA